MTTGRPSTYNEDIANLICERVALGENLNVISSDDGFPAQSTIYLWLDTHEAFSANYERARARRADSRNDRIDDYKRRAVKGELPVDAARLAIDVEKWQAGKENPKRYGEKIIHSGDVDAPAVFTLKLRSDAKGD